MVEEVEVEMDEKWSADLRNVEWAPLLELPSSRFRRGRAQTAEMVDRYVDAMEVLCWTGSGEVLQAASFDVQGYLWHPPRRNRAAMLALDLMLKALPGTRLENAAEVIDHNFAGIFSTVRADLTAEERRQEVVDFITARSDEFRALCARWPANLVVSLASALLSAEVDTPLVREIADQALGVARTADERRSIQVELARLG
ncbi:MAG: hypothetical protein HGA51_00480 [Demequinaceae bacterium]|nr:hypothetical protein [Demequinaceae bacterium]